VPLKTAAPLSASAERLPTSPARMESPSARPTKPPRMPLIAGPAGSRTRQPPGGPRPEVSGGRLRHRCTDRLRRPGAGCSDASLLARAAVVATAGGLYSRARGRLEREHGERLLRRPSILAFDVPERRRSPRWARGFGLSTRATVPRLASLASLWSVMVAVGDGRGMSFEVIA
jgi:hypothetical protein